MRQFPRNDIISLTAVQPRYDLAESVGPDLLLRELLDVAGSELAELPLAYGTAQGNPWVRELLAGLHGVNADEVILTVGGTHALFLLSFILCERGDEAVVTSPVFPVTRAGLETVGATVRTLQLSFDRCYQPDPAQLGELLTARTKLVSLASPQNPSGVALPPETIKAVIALMRERSPQAFLLVDETYREAAYGDAPIVPSAVTLDPRVVSIASLSKCHGAPGLRLGWVIARDATLRQQLLLAKFNTVVSCSPLDESLALLLLHRRAEIFDVRRKHLAAGLARTQDWARRNDAFVDWVRPDAGALCCVRLKPSVFDAAAVRRFYEVLGDKDTRVASGTWFGEEARVFRLGFGLLATVELEAALVVLEAALKEAHAS